MTTEPTSPMTDDSSEVVVWVSMVRTRVTSLERRETSSPTRLRAWKSSESVTRRVEQLAPHLGDDPLPHHAQEVGLHEAAQGLRQEQHDQPDDSASSAAELPPATTSVTSPATTSGTSSARPDPRTSPTSARLNGARCGRR